MTYIDNVCLPVVKVHDFLKMYALLRNYNKTESRTDVDRGFPVCLESNTLCLNRPVMCHGRNRV